jgi:hypothetical protein
VSDNSRRCENLSSGVILQKSGLSEIERTVEIYE